MVGSRADFTVDRVHPGSDWDLLVPFRLWELVVGALPLERVTPTRRGGWRVRPLVEGEPVIDIFPGDLGEWMAKACTRVAWHPKTGTVLEKV